MSAVLRHPAARVDLAADHDAAPDHDATGDPPKIKRTGPLKETGPASSVCFQPSPAVNTFEPDDRPADVDPEREAIGFCEFWRVIEDLAREKSFYDAVQQAVISFVAIASLAPAHFANGKSVRDLAASLTDLKCSHELLNREIERARLRLPQLYRVRGKKVAR